VIEFVIECHVFSNACVYTTLPLYSIIYFGCN
jgi:hypothetical protein